MTSCKEHFTLKGTWVDSRASLHCSLSPPYKIFLLFSSLERQQEERQEREEGYYNSLKVKYLCMYIQIIYKWTRRPRELVSSNSNFFIYVLCTKYCFLYNVPSCFTFKWEDSDGDGGWRRSIISWLKCIHTTIIHNITQKNNITSS